MKKLVVSFSSGESSAFMAHWCKENLQNEYEMLFIMANTSEENEKSFEFAKKCDEYFGLNLVIVEAITNPIHGEGIRAKIVTFENYTRDGSIFESMIAKHGIPNLNFPHCSRELKECTINAYCRSIGWTDYYKAIGYRVDEPRRLNVNWQEKKHIYPIMHFCPMTKPAINRFWRDMPFRLELKGYEDNCKVCWKKSLRKLLTLAKHHPERFDNFRKWEEKYGNFSPPSRQIPPNLPIRFYRDNLSVSDIFQLAKEDFEEAKDDKQKFIEYTQTSLFGHELDKGMGRCGSESCEAFSE